MLEDLCSEAVSSLSSANVVVAVVTEHVRDAGKAVSTSPSSVSPLSYAPPTNARSAKRPPPCVVEATGRRGEEG